LQLGLSACIRAINRHAEASWWIDHLEVLPQILVADYLRELASDPIVTKMRRNRHVREGQQVNL